MLEIGMNNVTRKGGMPPIEVKGNAKKYAAYREAWARIKQAQENEFFLEAITIQESIISDRLDSFLSRPDAKDNYKDKKKEGKFISFAQMIKYWRDELSAPLRSGDYVDLVDAVDEWRTSRNKAIHAIVKFGDGSGNKTIDNFLREAKEVAKSGEKLAREVCKWQRRKENR